MGYIGGRGAPTFRFQLTPVVKKLIIANVVIFVVSRVMGDGLVEGLFAFHPRRVLLQPWGAVTYMFLHGDLMHLAGNMIVLFFFGPPLEARWGALLKNGDIIQIDARKGTLNVKLSAEELKDRRKQWTGPRETIYGSGALWKYAQLVGSTKDGAVTHPGFAGERHVYADL